MDQWAVLVIISPPIRGRNILEAAHDYKTDDDVADNDALSPSDPMVMRAKAVRGRNAENQRNDGRLGVRP